MSALCHIEIDIAALDHNLKRIRECAPHSAVLAMVKANAYGHGLEKITKHLTHIDAFGIARLEEALLLRQCGIDKSIVLMAGFLRADELLPIATQNLDVVIHHSFQIQLLQQVSLPKPLRVWLKIDSGMHRLGFHVDMVQQAWQVLSTCRQVQQPVRLMTHFACADDRCNLSTQQQIDKFVSATHGIQAQRSLANSAGILGWKNSHAEWVRPGLMLYGVSPFIDSVGTDHDLLPVMTMRSKLIAIYERNRGDAIGYGHTWTCPEAMRIGIVAVGYGDGYPCHAVAGTPVLINGEYAPLIGRVSMDSLCVDLRKLPQAVIGDSVVLWGKGLPVEIIARHASTIPYELLCNVKQRGISQR